MSSPGVAHLSRPLLDARGVIGATVSVPAGSFAVGHEALRVKESTEIFARSCASKQKLWRQSIEWSLLPAQPAKSVFFFFLQTGKKC